MMQWKLGKLNELTEDEVKKIFHIRTEVFVVEQKCSDPDRDNRDDEAYHLFLIDNDTDTDDIVAYLRILDKGVAYDEVSIGRFLVNKNYRRRGFAKEALKRAMDFIENDLKEIEIRISAQEYLKSFYENVGFKAVSDVYLEENIPHIEMIKR